MLTGRPSSSTSHIAVQQQRQSHSWLQAHQLPTHPHLTHLLLTFACYMIPCRALGSSGSAAGSSGSYCKHS